MIEESKHNKLYKMLKKKGVPHYLEKRWGERRCTRIASLRLENEVTEKKENRNSPGIW